MALVSETKEGGICSDSENFVIPVCVSQEICLGPVSLFIMAFEELLEK